MTAPRDVRVSRRDILKLTVGGGAGLAVGGLLDWPALKAATDNLKLSNERAQATARAIDFPAARVNGRGETTLHDNDLPEGRFYSRTVDVVIERPIN